MKKVFKNLLYTSAALLVIYLLAQLVLLIFGLQFRAWINVWWLGAVVVTFVAGLFQRYFKTKNKIILISMGTAVILGFILLYTPIGLITILMLESIPHEEHVVVIDGYKFVGYKEDGWDVFIDFYDYKNSFVSGSKKRFTANGYNIDDDGNEVFYDELRDLEHLEDIYEYNLGNFDESELTKVAE